MSPYYAAARLWLDAIIDPLDGLARGRHPGLSSRARPGTGWISMGIEAASQPRVKPGVATRELNMGVFDAITG
ncbi:MAG: hypothetical protein IPK70_13845 [Flavobacteriales bacterium]|jgi:hypothetical protein|nr:hypothetical protein [Flavobacteriales bacterium]